jgi:hypothetical protein
MKNAHIDISKLESRVNTKMEKLLKESKFIEQGNMVPIHPNDSFINVGFMLLVGKMGSGKPNDGLKHLSIADYLCPNGTPFYSNIVYNGSVGEDEETYLTFKKASKIPIA